MELNKQIKKHRAEMNLSQEELAEKLYVTRQTISNWETGKNYPDIHSLLLMSTLFDVSLDQLIKGDVEIMKEEIKTEDIKMFDRYGKIFTGLLLLSIVSIAPLVYFLRLFGALIAAVLYIITIYYSIKIEKLKKDNDIQTYKEIIAFSNGEHLDEINKQREYGKRPYQKVVVVLLVSIASGVISFIAATSLIKLFSL